MNVHNISNEYIALTAVSVSLEVKPQLEDVIMELTPKSTLVRVFPLSVDDLERDVLVRRARVKSQNRKVLVIGARSLKRIEINIYYMYRMIFKKLLPSLRSVSADQNGTTFDPRIPCPSKVILN